jgi:hypothetical protein
VVKDHGHQPPVGDWREGAGAVAILSFEVDAEAPILAERDHYAEDLSAMSHQAYGPRVRVPRILELIAAREVKGAFFGPGVTAERWPGTVEKILDAGHVDIDALDGAYAPGTGVPGTGGLTSGETLKLVRGVASRGLIGMDLARWLLLSIPRTSPRLRPSASSWTPWPPTLGRKGRRRDAR